MTKLKGGFVVTSEAMYSDALTLQPPNVNKLKLLAN